MFAPEPNMEQTKHMTKLTAPQSTMLDTLDNVVVRRSFDSNGQSVWLFDGRRATAAEARVIAALQTKRLVKTVSQSVQIAGWVGSKAVARLVRA